MKDDAYMDGYAGYPCSIYANPFPADTVEFRRWVDGWVAGVIAERETMRIVAEFTRAPLTVDGSTPRP